jgi:hypothetical protein
MPLSYFLNGNTNNMARYRQLVLLYAAPCLLCIVAGVQRYLMEVHHLTSWKGGGFGMFSTARVDREITVTLVPRQGDEIRVSAAYINRFVRLGGDLTKRLGELRIMPSEGRLEYFARDLLKPAWILVKDKTGKLEYPLLQNDAPANIVSRPLELKEVRIEVWQYQFDPKGPYLRLYHFLTVSERAGGDLSGTP